MVTIVGVGPGSRRFISFYALEKIKNAEVLVGGRRHLEEFYDISCEKIAIDTSLEFKELLKRKENIVILSSGDPLLYGIAETILKYVDKDEVEIIPGISSVQYLCAKIKVSERGLQVLSLHGREEDFIGTLLKHKKVAIFTDAVRTPQYIAKKLKEKGIENVRIFVGENLSYDEERIYEFSVQELLEFNQDFRLNVVVITCGNM
ncbi:precorrin-6y C5,15-methyltransferase (decarboxylating) subunit CbiE [Caldanaerobacter sp.]|uniref:precorrin-6y C5,15-methyltransferase (decarboxylating) subunit CbiE n=1 Tax=Caldanaerobacter sp. TaxID=2930036 RepID=UPI003C788256